MFKIYFIHGLFGENFLPQDNLIKVISPYNFNHQTLQRMKKDSLVIGYSLGGRVLLRELYQLNKVPFKKVHLISTHFGIKENQRMERIKLENKLVSHFEERKINTFWNSLEIFKGDSEILINTDKINFYKKFFEQNRLSQQSYYLDFIKNHEDQFEFHLGEFDTKYRKLYESSGLRNIRIHSNCGHRGPINHLENIYIN